MTGSGLERFVEAQGRTYAQAIGELRAGAKRCHWMWFVFPQIAGLGRSPTAQFYALRDLAEARAFLKHPTLGPRLAECTQVMLTHAAGSSAENILGQVDAVKFRSSMTLFEAAGGDEPYGRALDLFFEGARDPATLERI